MLDSGPLDLSRHGARPRGALELLAGIGLAKGRVHECAGPARRVFALIAVRAALGPVIWIAPGWRGEHLVAEGMLTFTQPGRLLLVSPLQADDLLWSAEEALRSGAAPLVVAELPDPPALTPMRRLQLAAEAGHGVTGLLLTPGMGGAQGAESRWHLAPRPGPPGAQAWRLERLRARSEPPRSWEVSGCLAREGVVLSLSPA